jgi:hypothetical protein
MIFWPRLNTGRKSEYFSSIFTQANPNSVYESIFHNNMDDSSFNDRGDSLIKTITLPRQALGGYQENVAANSEAACKVSL